MTLRVRPRSKFGNVRTSVDGIAFDSAREARRWSELRLLQRAGVISYLQRQVRYRLTVNGVTIGHIVPDFRYVRDGKVVCEDVKAAPTKTPLWTWKAKHLAAEHGIVVEVVI
jgi:hypothetical protein